MHTSSKVWRLAPVRHLMALKRGLAADGPQIIAGDFNFWGPPVGALFRGWQRPVRGRTYPANRPHSQIDHVLVRGGIEAARRRGARGDAVGPPARPSPAANEPTR